MVTSFLSKLELQDLGFKFVGNNALVSRYARIYGASNISLADNCRIDDFCILSGQIEIGPYVHIASHSGLFAGDAGISIGAYAGISSRSALYAISDDFSGEYMTGPTIPDEFRKVNKHKLIIEDYAVIGTGSTLLPGAYMRTGSILASMSLIKREIPAWEIHAGIPAKYVSKRSEGLLDLQKKWAAQTL